VKAVLELDPPAQAVPRRFLGRMMIGLLLLASAILGAVAGLILVYSTDLPQVEELERYRPSSVTELYDQQGKVIGAFALQHRVIASYEQYPQILRDALIAVEDKDFYRHWGINIWRIAGAAYRDIISGGKVQGASTLTMQLARNLFLSPDRSFHRKIEEALLAIQIEHRFTKPQIFTLYANQIYLGHGVYGFEAASEFYFNKPALQLTLEEATLLAGLPKSPSLYSPISHPDRAIRRRNLVLNAMLEDGKITALQAARSRIQPLQLTLARDPSSLAPYFVEELRRYLEAKYGTDQVHEGGLRVYTSLDATLQREANLAVLNGLAAYERRHGWKGRLENVIVSGMSAATYQHPDWEETPEEGGYIHALVTEVNSGFATVKLGAYSAKIAQNQVLWTHRRLSQLLKTGDIVYVKIFSLTPEHKAAVSLEQDNGVQAALMALDNGTGEIVAMVGGRDPNLSKFNRATQALRQAGSSFKPYVYTAAIDRGARPDDPILDAPAMFQTASGPYVPHNYDEKFEGTITLRRALAQSRNIPAVRLAEQLGISTVIDYARRFGISSNLPPYLPIALGAADVTLFDQTAAYSVFPEDGVRISPRYITKVTDYDGHVLEENFAEVRDVISADTARSMTAMLQEVVKHGTAISADTLPIPVGGKTGTTNNFIDAWFLGFSPSITCGVWVGYDEKKTLGARESGARAALPVWTEFMRAASRGRDPGEFHPAPNLPPSSTSTRLDTPDTAAAEEEAH